MTVDGQPIASRAVLELRGEEGHSFTIELKRGFKRKSFEVMLTDRGPLPDALSPIVSLIAVVVVIAVTAGVEYVLFIRPNKLGESSNVELKYWFIPEE